MALAVHECAGLATLTLGKPAAPGLTAAGGLLRPPHPHPGRLCWRLGCLFTSSHHQGRATELQAGLAPRLLSGQSTEHLRLCMKQPQCMAGAWPWNAKTHRPHCSSPGPEGLGLQGMNACTLPPPQQPESTVHRLELGRAPLGTGMKLAHGLWSVASKGPVLSRSQSHQLADSGTMLYCEGAEQRGNKQISGKMSRGLGRVGRGQRLECFPEVLT